MNNQFVLPQEQLRNLIRTLETFSYQFYFEKHSVTVFNKESKILKINWPLYFSNIASINAAKTELELENYGSYLTMLIRAGDAAIAVVEDNVIVDYKHVKKYMVRKKQGKAQLSFLNSKGKSRAGSRIRLAQSIKFFEEINEYINKVYKGHEFQRLIYQISPALWPHWWNASPELLFNKEDERLRKANWTVNRPNYNELKRAKYFINCGQLSIFEPSIFDSIKQSLELNT